MRHHLKSHYLLNSNGRQMSSSELLKEMGLKPTSPIPLDYTDQKVIGGVTVIIEPSNKGKHRVKARCPNCGGLVPAGRLHQHAHSQICEEIRAEKQEGVTA